MVQIESRISSILAHLAATTTAVSSLLGRSSPGSIKVAKLAGNPEPYAHYYAAFSESLLESHRVLVIGYGAEDPHVNTWLREFGRAHGARRRIAWITRIEGRCAPS